MIYLVTNNRTLFECPEYEIVSPSAALNILYQIPVRESGLRLVGADTETEGLDVYSKKLLTIQLGDYNNQVVWDCLSFPVQMLRDFLEDPTNLTIWWNYLFDGKFLLHQRIFPAKVYDGFLAEKLLWNGYPAGHHSLALKAAGYNYCGVELDKTVRGQIITKGLTPQVVVYGANDVKYEVPIYEAQMKLLEEKDLIRAINFENEFVKCLVYIEYCGVKLDVPRWKRKMAKDQAEATKYKEELDAWVVQYHKDHPKETGRFVKVDLQGDLFSGFDTEPKCIINWASSKQVIPFLELLGFNLETFDKKTKQKKKSVDATIIKAQYHVSPIAKIYTKYKEAQKVVESFGQNYLDAINPITGRIHADFHQLGADTCRMSCGGGDAAVNLQNLPHDPETRACFIADKGNKWISADYQSQESRLIASVANDPAMIELFLNGCGDVHSLTAKMAYPDAIGDCPVEEIKDRFKYYRQEAKGIEFAINYGGDFNTIANNKGIPVKEAKEIYDNYMKGFPGVKRYQDYCRQEVMRRGYILLNPITGHKAFLYDWDELSRVQEKMKDPAFWQYYSEMKREDPQCETVADVRNYMRRKAASEKQSINYRME